MRVLIACEYSGRVREAFRKLGHDAWSCDILASDNPTLFHFQGDVFDIIGWGWDLMIAHPPCTHLAVSGARYFPEKIKDGRQQAALNFVQKLMDAPIDKICIENPISVISSKIRKPDQIIEPYQFGHSETKKTCLWLKNLNPLQPTKIVKPKFIIAGGKKYSPVHYYSYRDQATRAKIRSLTYQGIADAMAEQWGK